MENSGYLKDSSMPFMAFIMPGAGLTHHDGTPVLPKPEFMPPGSEIPYAQIFKQHGVDDVIVSACCLGAIKKLSAWIDSQCDYEILKERRSDFIDKMKSKNVFPESFLTNLDRYWMPKTY